MFNFIAASILIFTDAMTRKYFGLSASLSIFLPSLFIVFAIGKLTIPLVSINSLLFLLSNPIITIKTFFIGLYKTNILNNYIQKFYIAYLLQAFLLVWINGWGYPKRFESFNWYIMMGIEGDGNYSGAAISIITIILHLQNRISLPFLFLLNTLAFLLLFSRTAFLTILIYTLLNFIFRLVKKSIIFKVNIILLSILVSIPIFITQIPYELGIELDKITSGRFGIWNFIVSGEANFNSLSYYENKQAHNAIFQMINYFGLWFGLLIFFFFNVSLIKIINIDYWTYSFLAIILIQMFLNSYSAIYFLIWIIGGLYNGQYRNFRHG